MKLEDIASSRNSRTRAATPETGTVDDYGSKRNAAHPEIGELLKARAANALCDSTLARDEIELINFIGSKLEAYPSYVPSETVMQVIRNLCDRISGQASFAGMIRTG